MIFGEIVLKYNLDFDKALEVYKTLTPKRMLFLQAFLEVRDQKAWMHQRTSNFVDEFHNRPMTGGV